MNLRIFVKRGMPRLAAATVLTLAVGACSTMSDVGDEVGSAMSDVGDALDPTNWFSDNEPVLVDSAQSDSAVVTPDLASLPDRPEAAPSAANQAQVAQSLSSDRNQSAYSAEALRGGAEAAAPPPPASAQVAPVQLAPPVQQAVSSAPAAVGVLPEVENQAPQQAAAPAPRPAAPAASGSQPAVPPNSFGSQQQVAVNTASPSDAALGFKTSTAPALDPSVSQWVSAPIVSHYQQTAAQAGVSTSNAAGGATGTVSGPAYASLGSQVPVAVVQFANDGTALNAQARAQVRTAVDEFKVRGGQGYVRVVGHASSRTPNMSVEQHLTVIFEKSQARANAVAQELIRLGVPADHVLIEAVGDSQPIYYESMPEGETGNRRAEIFLQG